MNKRKVLAAFVAVVTMCWAIAARAAPVVNGNTLTVPSASGWYQVQDMSWTSMCERPPGGSCELSPGDYYVTNLNNGNRWEVAIESDGGGGQSGPAVTGNTVTVPSAPGWYQIQDTSWSSMCERGPGGSCELSSGDYYVTNLDNGDRWTVSVGGGGQGGGGQGGGGNSNPGTRSEPAVSGSTVTVPDIAGWYQIQDMAWNSMCERAPGGSCELDDGEYNVTNLDTAQRWLVQVGDSQGGGPGGGGSSCGDGQLGVGADLRDIVEHCDFPKSDFRIGIAIKDNFGQTWFDRSVAGCIAASPSQVVRYGECYNGTVDGNAFGHIQVARKEFNLITSENKQKMTYSQPTEPTYTEIGSADTGVGFVRDGMDSLRRNLGVNAGSMALHGHTLAFESSSNSVIPQWFINLGNNPKARDVMRDRVRRELRHYRNTNVPVWDVVNEVLPPGISANSPGALSAFRQSRENIDGILKQGVYFRALGEDWIKDMFTWARDELDSWGADARKPALIVNDVYVSWANNKSNALLELVRYLNEDRKLVDGVGFQAHIRDTWPSDSALDTVAANMRRFGNLGLDIYITEMDVRITRLVNDGVWYGGTLTLAEAREQSERYTRMLSACLNYSRCKAFQVWGLTDRFNWQTGQSVLFDGEAIDIGNGQYRFREKPAYRAVRSTLLDFWETGSR